MFFLQVTAFATARPRSRSSRPPAAPPARHRSSRGKHPRLAGRPSPRIAPRPRGAPDRAARRCGRITSWGADSPRPLPLIPGVSVRMLLSPAMAKALTGGRRFPNRRQADRPVGGGLGRDLARTAGAGAWANGADTPTVPAARSEGVRPTDRTRVVPSGWPGDPPTEFSIAGDSSPAKKPWLMAPSYTSCIVSRESHHAGEAGSISQANLIPREIQGTLSRRRFSRGLAMSHRTACSHEWPPPGPRGRSVHPEDHALSASP